MKIKNLTFVDRYLHWIVVGVAGVFLLTVAFFYVLGEPYAVEMPGTPEPVAPAAVEPKIREAAERLRRDVQSPDNPLPSLPLIRYTEAFKTRHTRPLSGPNLDELEVPLHEPGLDNRVFKFEGGGSTIFKLVTPPTPSNLQASVNYGLLEPGNNAAVVDHWVRLVGEREPRDLQYVSVRAVFDMREYRGLIAKLRPEERPSEDDILRSMAISDVILIRQELDPVSGAWSEPRRIDVMPSAISYREVTDGYLGDDPQGLITQIRVDQKKITWSEPPPTPIGHYAEPGTERLTNEQRQRLKELNQQISDLQSRLDENVPQRAPAAPRREAPRPAPAPAAPAAAPGAKPPAGARPPAAPVADDAMLDPAERARALQELAQLINEKNTLLGREPAQAGAGDEAAPAAVPAETSQIELLAHDVTVEPGKTYRYRVEVALLNPLFNKKDIKDLNLAKPVALESDLKVTDPAAVDTRWTEAVEVPRTSYFYVVNPQPPQGVVVEIYRLYKGAWQAAQVTVRPGDAIRAVKDGVEFSADGVAVDVDLNATGGGALPNRTAKLIFLERSSNTLRSRLLDRDVADPRRNQLRQEAELARGEAASGAVSQR